MATDPGTPTATEQSVQTQGSSSAGTNTTATTTNTIVQYPRPPRRDDGKWMSIGSMVGSLFGMLYNADIIDDAKDAEKKWRELTDHFNDTGIKLENWADTLVPCNDELHAALCKFAQCGYQADYAGVFRRARQSAGLAAAAAWRKVCRGSQRYNVGLNDDVYSGILRAEIMATVQATTLAVEQEREKAFELNYELLAKTTQIFEADYLNRMKMSADYLAGAGTNYGFLAQSLRATAKADMGDMTALGAALGILLPIAFSYGCNPEDYCEGGTAGGTITPSVVTT